MRIVAGEARSRTILAPPGRETRPTLDRVRENLFNILQWRCPGARVLDLFAGSGALALEALSRGAAFALLADRDPRAVAVARRNVEALGFSDRAQVQRGDWKETLRALAGSAAPFELVFLDPPYAFAQVGEVFAALLAGGLLHGESRLVLERQAGESPREMAGFTCLDSRRYGYVGVHIFGVKGEG